MTAVIVSRPRLGRFRSAALVTICGLGLAACEPISLTMLGVGAATGVNHQLGGLVYKTFTEPEPKVRRAALAALNRMAIKIESVTKIKNGESIKGKAADRNIEIELESLTPATTRMRVAARREGAILVDSATAVEIIGQTERQLGGHLANNN